MEKKLHPCQKCGACCSIFRVSFNAIEASENSFHVPSDYTVRLSSQEMALKFVSPNKKRCQALEGKIGQSVGCSIYLRRPSPCRNFKASFEDGTRNNRCDQARAAMQLAPLTLADWNEIGDETVENQNSIG